MDKIKALSRIIIAISIITGYISYSTQTCILFLFIGHTHNYLLHYYFRNVGTEKEMEIFSGLLREISV